MTSSETPVSDAGQAENTDASTSSPGLTDNLGALTRATRNWFSESLGLILLDGQLAGVSLVRMLIYGVIAVFLFITGWLGLMLAMAIALQRLDVPLEVVVLLVTLLSIVAGVLLILRINSLSSNLTFKSTRNRLGSGEGDTNSSDAEQ